MQAQPGSPANKPTRRLALDGEPLRAFQRVGARRAREGSQPDRGETLGVDSGAQRHSPASRSGDTPICIT